jgi:iron(III) transport system permease protein
MPSALFLAASIGPLLVLLPIVAALATALGAGWATVRLLLFRPLVGELLGNTLTLMAASMLAAGLLGLAWAWLVERTELPGRRAWAVLAAAPLAIPPFVSGFAWVSIAPVFEGFLGAWLVVTCTYTPLVYLPVAASLRGLDPALEETAMALGLGRWRVFLRVVLPQLRPALLGGMLLVALDVLVEFGAFALLRYRTFTTTIYAQYRTGFNGDAAAMLAFVLLLLCLGCLAGEAWVRGRARYARMGKGAKRRAGLLPLGVWTAPALAVLAVPVAAGLLLPLATILFWMTQSASAAISPAEATWDGLLAATWSSLWLGLAGAALTVLLALPLAYLVARRPGRLAMLLERTAFLAMGAPGIVVALALSGLAVRYLRVVYESAALLLVTYAILFLPLAVVSVRAALEQAQKSLEEVATSLGQGWVATAWRVVLPLAGPGLGAAAALVFVSVSTELTATLLLAPIGTRTLATEVWADTSTLAFAAASPYAAVMTLFSLLSTWLLARRFAASLGT